MIHPIKEILVASGEQSFLYLILNGVLPKEGKFQTITPCFRNEKEDLFHKKTFIKNELIIIDPESNSILDEMIITAWKNSF